MKLLGSDSVIGMLRNYRVVWIDGRYGGGKTSLAHVLFLELKRIGFVNYLISNIHSIWRDDPAKIELVGGRLANACVILDEAGLFLETGSDARKFLAYLRKMNIILIMPSVVEPSSKVTFLSIQRVMTFDTVGLPLWWYEMSLRYGRVRQSTKFMLWRPSGIFGIYDSAGAPDDDGGLDWYVQKWSKELQENTGYGLAAKQERRRKVGNIQELSGKTDVGGISVGQELEQFQLRQMGEARRNAELFAESASQISQAISVSQQRVSSKRGH